MSRRVFTREFKIAAVKLIVEDEMDVKDVSKQLGVHANSLYRWVQEYEEYGESAFQAKGVGFTTTRRKSTDCNARTEILRNSWHC